jgi:hypothetical protein
LGQRERSLLPDSSAIAPGIATGVGLASESAQHHKEKKAAKKAEATQREQSVAQSPPAYEEHEHKSAEYAGCEKKGAEQRERSLEGDEEQWDLDDVQGELISSAPSPKNRPLRARSQENHTALH